MSFINNNEFNHRDYNLLLQSLSSGPPPPSGDITGGPVTVSTITAFGSPAMHAIDADRSIIAYQRGGVFDVFGVVVDISSGTPVFGTPVQLDSSTGRVPIAIRAVPGSSNELIVFERSSGNVFAQVIEVSGTVITRPNAIYSKATTPYTTSGFGSGEMLSATTGGIIVNTNFFGSNAISCVPFTLAAGVVTFGNIAASTLFSLGGGGGRAIVDSGQIICFGRDISGSPAYIGALAFDVSGLVATPTALYLPPLVADRIRIDSANGLGATAPLAGGIAGYLYQDFTTGSVASVRAAWSGTAATYSNSDSSKNILPALPYPPPAAAAIQGYGQYSGTGNLCVMSQNVGGTISLYTVNVSGNVNMGSVITAVAAGATAFRSELVFNDTTTITFEYITSVGSFLACGIATYS